MRHQLFNTIIIVLLMLLGLLVLLITLTSSIKFKDVGIEGTYDNSYFNINADPNLEQHTLDVDFINFKIHTLQKIEQNNQDIIKITKKINDAQSIIEEERTRRIFNLKKQNTQLKADLNTYQKRPSKWQRFKSNFSVNLNRMGVSFVELLDTKKII